MNGIRDDIMVFMEGVLSVTLLRSWREVNLLFAPAVLRHVYKTCLHFDSVADKRVNILSTYVKCDENLVYSINILACLK